MVTRGGILCLGWVHSDNNDRGSFWLAERSPMRKRENNGGRNEEK